MTKVAIITNIPAPYRVSFFRFLIDKATDFKFKIIFTSPNESNRQWSSQPLPSDSYVTLASKVLERKGSMDSRYIHFPKGLKKELNSFSPDVVIAAEYNLSAILALRWCRRHKVPFIHQTDGTLRSESQLGSLHRALRKYIIKRSSAFLASSSLCSEKIKHYGGLQDAIFKAFLTVDLSSYEGPVSGDRSDSLLFVGRCVPGKGIDLLLSAFRFLPDSLNLRIVGGADEETKKEYLQLATNYGIKAERISFQPFKEGQELIDEYRKAKVFVLPTRGDCFGLVLLEAAASGTPIVTTPFADGAPDIITTGENGFICDPNDANRFANSIMEASKLVISEKKRREIIQKFSFAEVAKGYLSAIKYALTEHDNR